MSNNNDVMDRLLGSDEVPEDGDDLSDKTGVTVDVDFPFSGQSAWIRGVLFRWSKAGIWLLPVRVLLLSGPTHVSQPHRRPHALSPDLAPSRSLRASKFLVSCQRIPRPDHA